jgi:hypothetical protein
MDAENVFPILMVVILVAACIFAALILSGIVAFVVWFMRRNNRVFQDASDALKQDSDSYLFDSAAQMQSWQAGALADFSSHLEIFGRRIAWSLHYRGALKSLSQPEAFGWLAFDLQIERTKGQIELRTEQSTYLLEIKGAVLDVRVDGQPLGALQARGSIVTLLGANARPVGGYQRPSRGWGLSLGGDYLKPTYAPVRVRKRQVAEFNNNMLLSKHLKLLKGDIPPLYRNLASDLSAEESDWLLALLGFEIYQRISRHLREKSRRRNLAY